MATYTVISASLSNLGLKIAFDGRYHCIDSDGAYLKSFELKADAINYFREIYADVLAANK